MAKTNSQQSVLAVLEYFDLFNLPLTRLDIKKNFLDIPIAESAKKVGFDQGYFYVNGNKDSVARHLCCKSIQEEKWKIALLGAKLIAWLPFVKMIAVCNTLADGGAKKNSDIDFFIITKSNRIWLTRFLVTLVLDLWRLRRHGEKINNRICLSFYITDKLLNLSPLQIKGSNETAPQDTYLVYWLANLKVIYSYQGTARSFFRSNIWIKKYLPNWYPSLGVPGFRSLEKSVSRRFFKGLFETLLGGFLGNRLNQIQKKLQLVKIRQNNLSKLTEDSTDVVVSDNVLKFHEQDKRQEIQQRFIERIS